MKKSSLFKLQKNIPLAARMRPRNFDEFFGQEHIVGKGKALRLAIERDQLQSLILWGPPGCGKTSLAYLIAQVTQSHYEYLSAVTSALADLRKILADAKARTDLGQKTILTIDEVHRWNKAQQAALLPYVEDGIVIMIGCTTENPYFEVIGPLVSRSSVYKLQTLGQDEIKKILQVALKDRERGIARDAKGIKISIKIFDLIIEYSNGDARRALNILEGVVNLVKKRRGKKEISKSQIEDVIQRRTILYDKDKDAHYDTISAFIKSMRGSDPDAAIFYLVKMLEAGEDPKFIARRITILASEDIGNADPNALRVATAAFEAVEKVGLPEAELTLAQATIYMATAPKSNAVLRALMGAKRDLKNKGAGEVPMHLRNPAHPGMVEHGYGKDYQYVHDYDSGYVPSETYLPKHLKGSRYYQPSNRGYEKIIKARLEEWKRKK